MKDNKVRGDREYIHYLEGRWAWPRSWLPDISGIYSVFFSFFMFF